MGRVGVATGSVSARGVRYKKPQGPIDVGCVLVTVLNVCTCRTFGVVTPCVSFSEKSPQDHCPARISACTRACDDLRRKNG